MMISPESYYEMNLKGKSEEEIRSAIRGLKREIGHLKNVMEHPSYGTQVLTCPTEDVRIQFNRMYLERAKQALFEMGASYTPSRAELRAERFQENIDCIRKIEFYIGGFFGSRETCTVSIDGEHIQYDTERFFGRNAFSLPDSIGNGMSKADFLDALRELYMGEWQSTYRTERFGYVVMDGTQWSLKIEYSNGTRTAYFSGSNAYPYNFDKLKALFGIEDDEEEDFQEDE